MKRVLVSGALVCFVGAGVLTLQGSAGASAVPGSAFFGYTLTAQSQGLQLTEDEPSANSHPEAEGDVPQSQVSLTSGPVGYALSAVAWPGALVGNAGSLAILATNGKAPSQATLANDPERAESRTGQAKPDVSNDTVPGTSLTAGVHPSTATAHALVDGGSATSTVGFGKTSSDSTAVLMATSATTTADSTSKDASLAGGAVKIGSVVSHAEAHTDGVTATASGTTTVSDMTVGGVPVTVDEKGVHVDGQGSGIDPAAAQTVNSTISSLNMTIALSTPSESRTGGQISYDAGSLLVYWAPPGSANTFTAALGGARVLAAAVPGSTYTPPPVTQRSQAPVSVATVPSSAPVSGATQPIAVAPAPGNVVPQPTVVSHPSTPSVTAAPVPQAFSSPLLDGDGIPAWAAVLALLGGLLLLGGFWAAPAAVFVEPSPDRCPLEETP